LPVRVAVAGPTPFTASTLAFRIRGACPRNWQQTLKPASGGSARTPIYSANMERKANTLDLLVLVAATAVGIGICILLDREYWRINHIFPPLPLPSPPEAAEAPELAPQFPPEEIGLATIRYLSYFAMMLSAWTPALLCIRLRRPRDSMRDLVQGFSTSATVTANVTLLAHAVSFAAQTLLNRHFFDIPDPDWVGGAQSLFRTPAPGIMASWVIVLLLGPRPIRRSWIGLLELLLAASWHLLYLQPITTTVVRLMC
jgi:hypothetical protein